MYGGIFFRDEARSPDCVFRSQGGEKKTTEALRGEGFDKFSAVSTSQN